MLEFVIFNGKHPWKDPSKLSQTFKTPLLFHKEKATNNPQKKYQKKQQQRKKSGKKKTAIYTSPTSFFRSSIGGVSDGSHGVVGTVYSSGNPWYRHHVGLSATVGPNAI